MITLISPAKNLNFDRVSGIPRATKPVLLDDVAELSTVTKKLTRAKLKQLMGISENLADLNYERFQAFSPEGKGESLKAAAFAFNGDVYLGLDAASLSADDLKFGQKNLRILSGLYGILRPLDAIQPYRLEMGSRLKNMRGKNLYEFWGAQIADEINKASAKHEDAAIINLASVEYFKAVDRKVLKSEIITPVFMEEKDGKQRQIQFYAKRARGLMARWIMQERVETRNALTAFSVDGYRLSQDQSSDSKLVFVRPQPKPQKAA